MGKASLSSALFHSGSYYYNKARKGESGHNGIVTHWAGTVSYMTIKHWTYLEKKNKNYD